MGNGRRDVAKEQRWREVLARHGSSGLSVREFCQRESLAESAFHSWRRTLALRDGQVAPRRRQIAARDGRFTGRDGQVAASSAALNEPTFVPAVVTHGARGASALPSEGAITIELSGGRLLRLPASIDVARIAELVQALEARGVR